MVLTHDRPVAEAALGIANLTQRLATGPLAELRRMTGSGVPGFWRLAAQYPSTIGTPARQREWMDIVRVIAILTPKGDPEQRPALHAAARRLGAVLCDGGDPDPQWSGQPCLSERRLTQLMAARKPLRTVLLARAARMLAQKRLSGDGVNVVDVAWAVLRPDDERLLAEPYYRRLDRAEQIASQTTQQ